MKGFVLVVCLLCVARVAAAAEPVYLEVRGAAAMTIDELREAVAARITVASEPRAQVVVVTVVLAADAATVVADGRVARVGLAGRSGPAAARVVAIGVTDLLARMPTVPAPADRRPTIAVWPSFLVGPGALEPSSLGGTLDLSGAVGRVRVAGALAVSRVLVSNDELLPMTDVTLRAMLGLRLGRLELRAGPLLTVSTVAYGDGDTSLRPGATAGALFAVELGRDLALVIAGGVDAYARRLRYLEGQSPRMETARVAPWAGVGLAWGWGR